MGLVLDTSALIAWERAMTSGKELSLNGDEDIVLPAIVWAEALIGVRMADSAARAARRRAQLEGIHRLLDVIPFTSDIAEHYADIFAELAAMGTRIPQNDIAVAATARSLGFGVLVGPKDEVHFKKISDLEVRVLKD